LKARFSICQQVGACIAGVAFYPAYTVFYFFGTKFVSGLLIYREKDIIPTTSAMMKKVSIILIMVFWPVFVFPQFIPREKEKNEDPDISELSVRERFFVGGFLGLQFGDFTMVGVNTHAGFRITNRLSAGIGGTYQYINDRWLGQSLSSHTYGGGVFARFRVFDQLFVHAEQEWLNLMSRPDNSGPETRQRISEDNFLLGPGYGLRLSEKVRLNLLVLYNFNKDSQVYFTNPFFRVGVDIYL